MRVCWYDLCVSPVLISNCVEEGEEEKTPMDKSGGVNCKLMYEDLNMNL